MSKRRTKKQYMMLFNQPHLLFDGCEVILWPNGEPEIWIKSDDKGFRITASEGPAGLGLRVNRFVGGPSITVTGNLDPDCEVAPQADFFEVTMTQYSSDLNSQAFKRWYGGKGPHPDEGGTEQT